MLKLIVGLGNPGKEYARTRHNVGFRAVTAIAEKYNLKSQKSYQCYSLIGEGIIADKDVVVAQPLTYMNKSGKAVAFLINYYKVVLEDVIIIYDDLDLPPGRLRIKTSGSSGGHNGLKSIFNYLDTQKIPRIRIGIGHSSGDTKSYVLGHFNSEEEKIIKKAIKNVVKAVEVILKDGFQTAMNKFN